jgi:hypothetical protein
MAGRGGEMILKINTELEINDPEIELADEMFDWVYVDEEGDLSFRIDDNDIRFVFNSSQARDLAKILNYWAEHGRLPTRIKLKDQS